MSYKGLITGKSSGALTVVEDDVFVLNPETSETETLGYTPQAQLQADTFPYPEFELKKTISHPDCDYNSWPISRAFYDEETECWYLAFTAKTSHSDTGGKIVMYRLADIPGAEWEFLSVIIDGAALGGQVGPSSVEVMPDGSFFHVCEVLGVHHKVSRSTDKGVSWTTDRLYDTNGNALDRGDAGNVPSGLFKTKGGNVLAAAWSGSAPLRVWRWTDPNAYGGIEIYEVPNGNNLAGNPMEGSFEQMADDKIVLILRPDISDVGDYPATLVYTTSDDEAVTWADLDYTNITNCWRDNLSPIHHPETRTIEGFYTARTESWTGRGTIWYFVTSEEAYAKGDLGTPVPIGSGSPGQDFGGSSAAKNNKGRILFTYYDRSDFGNGPEDITEIYTYIGKRVKQLPKKQLLTIGEDVEGSASATGAELDLSKVLGTLYNYDAPSSATTYTTANPVLNGYASVKINAASEPTVTGGTKIAGATFVADTDMEMIVEYKGSVRYFFLEL